MKNKPNGSKRYDLSAFMEQIPVGSFQGRPDNYVHVHNHRCAFHQAQRATVFFAREVIYTRLLRCTDPGCYVALGEVKVSPEFGTVTQADARKAHRTATGHPYGWISREERQRAAYSDPKTTRELVNFLGRRRPPKEGAP